VATQGPPITHEPGDEAVALVQSHWTAISDVAQELLRCQTITGERLDEIIACVGIDLTA
jgi:hypothetical protein